MTGRNRDSTDYGHSKLTRYFDDFLNDVGLTRTNGSIRRMGPGEDKHATWSPAIDITENDGEYVVIADVPGVRKEDLDIELHHSMLVISGQNHQDPHTTAQLSQEIGVGRDRQHQINEPQPQDYQPQQYPQYPNQQPQVTTQPNQPTQMTQPNQPTQMTQPNQPTQMTQPNQTTQTTQPTQTTRTAQPIKTNHPPEEHEYQHTKYRQQRNKENRENRENRENNSSRLHVQERPYGYFSRSIQLPNDIKAEDNIQASLENGVLKIRVPKNNDRPRRKITVT